MGHTGHGDSNEVALEQAEDLLVAEGQHDVRARRHDRELNELHDGVLVRKVQRARDDSHEQAGLEPLQQAVVSSLATESPGLRGRVAAWLRWGGRLMHGGAASRHAVILTSYRHGPDGG